MSLPEIVCSGVEFEVQSFLIGLGTGVLSVILLLSIWECVAR